MKNRASLISLVPAWPPSLPAGLRFRWRGPARRCRQPRHTACPGPARAGAAGRWPGHAAPGLGGTGLAGGGAGRLGGPLDGPCAHGDPGQVFKQRGGLAEGDLRAGPGDHLGKTRRQRRPGHPQLLIARSEAALAFPAVIPGPGHLHRAEGRADRLGPAARVAGLVTGAALGVRAGARHRRPGRPPAAGHQPRPARPASPAPARRAAPGAQQAGGHRSQLAYLRSGDLREVRREPPLSPSAGGGAACRGTGLAAQIASLTALTSSTKAANRWCSATSRSAFSSSGPGFRCTFTVLPPMRRVRFHCGPWPRCPGCAHAQFGLPHLRHTAFSAPRRKSPPGRSGRIAPRGGAPARPGHDRRSQPQMPP